MEKLISDYRHSCKFDEDRWSGKCRDTTTAHTASLALADRLLTPLVAGSMKRSCVPPSVCLSHLATAVASCGGFAAERRTGGRHRSTAAAPGCQQQRRRSAVLGRKCVHCHVYSRRRKLSSTDLLTTGLVNALSDGGGGLRVKFTPSMSRE